MRVLFALIAAGTLAGTSPAIAACPTPSTSAGITPPPAAYAEWRWRHNSDGYARVIMPRDNLGRAWPRIDCSVMEEVILFGGRFAIEVEDRAGPFTVDVTLPDVDVNYVYDSSFNATLWHRQSNELARSAVAVGVSRTLDELLQHRFDRSWEVTFVHQPGATDVRWQLRMRDPLNPGRKWATFTADFTNGMSEVPAILQALSLG